MLFRVTLCFVIAAAAAAFGADPALLNLLPPGAKVIAGADLAASRNTPFGNYVLSTLDRHAGRLDAFSGEAGFDPRLDLFEIVVGGSGVQRGSEGVMVFGGRFNVTALTRYAQANGARVGAYQGTPLISGHRERGPVTALLSPDAAVMGRRDFVQASVDRAKSGATLDPLTADRVSAVSAGRHAWLLLIGSPAELAGHFDDRTLQGAMKGDIIKAIQEMSGGVTFGDVVEMSGEAVTKTAEDAEALANVVDFLIGFAQLTDDRDFAALLASLTSGMKMDVIGNRLQISVSLPEADFEKLLERFHRGRRGAASAGDRGRSPRSSRPGTGR